VSSSRFPRWARVSLVVVISLVVIFYGAGGLLFSNMIRTDALEPRPPTPDNGVYVVEVSNSEIILTSSEPREDTTRPGIAGLAWDGGYGSLGDIISIDGLRVRREFQVVSGSPPDVCSGELPTCNEVDIEGWAYETDPSDVGLDYEEVTFASPIGTLGAWRVSAGDGAKWVIHTHGWRTARREAVRTLPIYHEVGITSLVIDYRNDEGAPDDATGVYRFGRSEWEDVEGAVRYALDQGAESVILHGYSTGSAINLAFLENSDLAEEIDAAVHDSPNIDMADTVRHGASERSIPGTPIPVPGSLTEVAMFFADLRWDVGWGDIDYVERAGEIVHIPMLVFHGTEDTRVPIDESREFRDSAADWVQLVEVEDAGHVTSWNVDPDSYERRLTSFLTEIE
jgi:pimeloyl-ACP methyl ester carboxylesterase